MLWNDIFDALGPFDKANCIWGKILLKTKGVELLFIREAVEVKMMKMVIAYAIIKCRACDFIARDTAKIVDK